MDGISEPYRALTRNSIDMVFRKISFEDYLTNVARNSISEKHAEADRVTNREIEN